MNHLRKNKNQPTLKKSSLYHAAVKLDQLEHRRKEWSLSLLLMNPKTDTAFLCLHLSYCGRLTGMWCMLLQVLAQACVFGLCICDGQVP